MGCSVSMINGHPDIEDIWEPLDNRGAYYDVYKCRNCGTVIVVADYCELPSYCKECEKYDTL